jgi:thymidylate kinase
MRITKSQLRQLIKEELKVVLTNEEAGELFGEEIEALLNELDEDESKGTSQ